MIKISTILIAFYLFKLKSCSSDKPVSVDETTVVYRKFFSHIINYIILQLKRLHLSKKLINGYIIANESIARLLLWMPVSPSIGTLQLQNLSATNSNIAILYSGSFWLEDDVFLDITGSIPISAFDSDYIKGTFSCTGTTSDGATITISKGTFIMYN